MPAASDLQCATTLLLQAFVAVQAGNKAAAPQTLAVCACRHQCPPDAVRLPHQLPRSYRAPQPRPPAVQLVRFRCTHHALHAMAWSLHRNQQPTAVWAEGPDTPNPCRQASVWALPSVHSQRGLLCGSGPATNQLQPAYFSLSLAGVEFLVAPVGAGAFTGPIHARDEPSSEDADA